eukprot:1343377-Rhodomonas_salina.1
MFVTAGTLSWFRAESFVFEQDPGVVRLWWFAVMQKVKAIAMQTSPPPASIPQAFDRQKTTNLRPTNRKPQTPNSERFSVRSQLWLGVRGNDALRPVQQDPP